MNKKSIKELKHLENARDFEMKWKVFFIIFKDFFLLKQMKKTLRVFNGCVACYFRFKVTFI